jgi:hypothetical protein
MMPIFLDNSLRLSHFSLPPSSTTALPQQKKITALPSTQSRASSNESDYLTADLSEAFRFAVETDWIGSGWKGITCTGFTTALYGPIGTVLAYDQIKKIKYSEHIGDTEGALTAKVRVVEHAFFSAGSFAAIPVRIFSLIPVIGSAWHLMLSIGSHILTTASLAFSWLVTVNFGVSYLINGFRHGRRLWNWKQGSQLRDELLKAQDPIQELFQKQLAPKIYSLNQDYKQLALDAGERWLKSVAKEAAKYDIPFDNSRNSFESIIQKNPQLIETFIGPSPIALTPEGELIRFGKYLAIQNECALFQEECARQLGDKALEALKTNDPEIFREALASKKEVAMMALKITVGIAGVVSALAGTVLTGFIPMGVVLGFMAIASLGLVLFEDWDLIRARLENPEFGKWDRFCIKLRLSAAFLSLTILIGLSIATGGVTAYLAALIIVIGCFAVASGEAYMLWKRDNRPWDFQKIPTIEALHALVKTGADEEKVQETAARMLEKDRKWIAEQQDLRAALDAREKSIEDEKKRMIALLAREL